jgi:hypothetical protein
MDFAWFMMLLMNPFVLIVGILLGVTWTLCGASSAYRWTRRRALRRNWQQNKPRHFSPLLTPRWDEYDPDESHVDSRCVCHNRKVNPGETVLLWPEAGQLGLIHISVYCTAVKETV